MGRVAERIMFTPELKTLLERDEAALKKLRKVELIEWTLLLQKELVSYKQRQQQEQDDQINKKINEEVNKPSSKKPEWDKDGNPVKNRNNRKKRSKRPGCGNANKTDLDPDEVNTIPLDSCPDCRLDLRRRKSTDAPGRLVEDINPPQEKTTLCKEIEQLKWCPRCKKMVSSKTEKALPGSDIGLNATIEIAYLWVMSALSLPLIQAIIQSFVAYQLR